MKTILQNSRTYTRICAFFLPCILFLTVLAVIGIYPFGDRSLLIIDMNNEYIDYLAQMNASVRTGGSLLRSWNMGMGLNMLGLIAFYTVSPFNLLVMLLPVRYITEVIFVITVLKIGTAGLLHAVYTEYTIGRRGLFAVAFAVAYAMCAYNIAYASNIMWLDGAAFLPLVLLGVEKLLRENKCGVFLCALVYVFYTSYYIAYMIGLFAFLYFSAVWFSRQSSLREYGVKLLRFLGTALLAAGICAFLLLPAYFSLKNGQSTMWSINASPALQKPFVRIASRLLPGVYDTLTDPGYPNIYSSVLAVLFCAVYFITKEITKREKLIFGGLLAFLFVSFSSDLLDLIWHAFEDPTWFPARYSFVFSFLVIYLAMCAANRANTLTTTCIIGAVGMLILGIVEIGIGRYRYVTMGSLVAGVLLLTVYAILWRFWQRKKSRAAWVGMAALTLLCGEVWVNALVMERQLDAQFQYKMRESYTDFRNQYGPAVNWVRETDTSVYRMEIVEQRNANGGMALGYHGISHYSTTTDQTLNAFLCRLGYNRGTENELRFSKSTPLTNGLLGIRYILSTQNPGGGYELKETVGEVGIYENTVAFPMAFWAPESAMAFRAEIGENPFSLQNDLVYALTEHPGGFQIIPDIQYTMHHVDREEMEDHIRYIPRVMDETGVVVYSIYNPGGREAYAYFPVWKRRFTGANVKLDGQFLQQELLYRKNTILPLGNRENSSLELELEQNSAYIAGEYFYTLDLEAAEKASKAAEEYAMDFEIFTDTRIVGTVIAPTDGVLATTFPADPGWRIWIDGIKTRPLTLAGVFLSVEMTAGEHEIIMRYWPPGFITGCSLSCISLLGILIYMISMRYKEK